MSIRGRWIWDEAKQDLIPADEFHKPQPKRSSFPTPLLNRDISEYHSPIDGRLISSRTGRNEDCKRNESIPWEPGIGKNAGADKRTPGKYKNPNFAVKRHLPLNEEAAEKFYRKQKEEK